jgi:hypothetical protein
VEQERLKDLAAKKKPENLEVQSSPQTGPW